MIMRKKEAAPEFEEGILEQGAVLTEADYLRR